jgi:rRNA-processing protein FCF1
MASSSKTPVVLDTNFVLSCYRFGISLDEIERVVDEGHEIVVPSNVLAELKRLPLRGKDREARTIMLSLLARYKILPLQGPVDDSLLEYAQTHPCIICTNDRELKKNVKILGMRVIFVRSRSHLSLE